jgi:hypothetical protein
MNLWDQSGVPHRGWNCIQVDDLGEPSATRQMCGQEHSRSRQKGRSLRLTSGQRLEHGHADRQIRGIELQEKQFGQHLVDIGPRRNDGHRVGRQLRALCKLAGIEQSCGVRVYL